MSVRHVMAALTAKGPTAGRLSVVTRGAVDIPGDAGACSLAQVPAWGLGRTVALEYPDRWGSLIDIDPADSTDPARDLALELLAPSSEDQVALRATGRFVARLVRAGVASSAPVALSSDGTYLVTGGAGALGLRAAAWLVERGARHVVLASRRATAAGETPVVREAVAAMEQRGASIHLADLDVADGAEVDAMLRRIAASNHPLSGIVHAAGTDATVPFEALTPAILWDAFAAKAVGAWQLHERTRDLPLDLFVCFSSVASVLGSQRRAHYAAANAFLDGLAAVRRRSGQAATSIDWGPWRGGGMASGEHLRQFERIGNRGLDPAAAVGALDAIAGSNRPHAIVADIDWTVFAPAYSARRARPVLAELARTGAAEETHGAALAPWVARLDGVPVGAREAEMIALVQREVAETMGFDAADSVPVDRDFYELGVDSLMMADLVGRLRRQVGFSCSTLVFDHPTARDVARAILPLLPLAGADRNAELEAPQTGGSAADARAEQTMGYAPAVEERAFAFQAASWPHRDPALIPDRWRWMFVRSARRLGREPRIWLHTDGGRVVGHMGSIAVKLKAGNEILDTGWLVDTMVSDDHRRRGLGSRLMVQAHEDQPFSLSLGQTAEMREIQFRLGWQRVAPLEVGQLLIRPENVMRAKLPRPAALAAGLGLRASTAVRDLLRGASRLQARSVERFDERHDRLWERVAGGMQCGVVRDASYLNWKYVDQPGQCFVRLELFDGDRLAAVAVLTLREPDAAYKYTRALLVDLVAPFDDPTALAEVARAAAASAAERGADALLCLHVGVALTRALKTCGFVMRRPERVLLVDTATLPPETRALLADGGNWFVTQGDSDIDRPW